MEWKGEEEGERGGSRFRMIRSCTVRKGSREIERRIESKRVRVETSSTWEASRLNPTWESGRRREGRGIEFIGAKVNVSLFSSLIIR